PRGEYRVRVYKGTEYRNETREAVIEPGRTAELAVALKRWGNPAERGWDSSDCHLHIARPYRELNPPVAKWMQAEDIHVANLLHYGHIRYFRNTPQYAFGPEGQYHEGDYWLASGQENPRTDVLGHTLTLGGKRPIGFPDDYLVYRHI